MTQITKKPTRTLLAGLVAVLGVLGLQAPAVSAAPESPNAQVVQYRAASCGDTSGFETVALSALPPEAAETVELIQQGGPFPYPQDGDVFHNWEGRLPECEDGYYREYTVETPGSDDRGARRFVVGANGEYFYTDDHYESFRLTDVNA